MKVIDAFPESVRLPLKGLIYFSAIVAGLALAVGTVILIGWLVIVVGKWIIATISPMYFWIFIGAIAAYFFFGWIGYNMEEGNW